MKKIYLVGVNPQNMMALAAAEAYLVQHNIEGTLIPIEKVEDIPIDARSAFVTDPKPAKLEIKEFALSNYDDVPIIEPATPKHKQKKFEKRMQNFHRGFNPKKR